MRTFESGATRNSDNEALDYEGFISPVVLKVFGEYMHKHRLQADGNLRDSDNWQKGIPQEQYVKSLIRHTHDLWMENRGFKSREGRLDAICGVLFNAMGWLYEEVKNDERYKR